MSEKTHKKRWFMVLGGASLLVAASSSRADAQAEHRYPYDPACPWGRLADGHGMLIRCLGQDEATALSQAPSAEPSPASPAETAETPDTKPAEEPESPPQVKLRVEKVGPLKVETGELPLAIKKLSVPKDRYIECVQENGGLSASSGDVTVRFLVRERGRAEGVSVERFSGMSKKAATCIAHVVDRRYVGYPSAPIVGATLVMTIGKAE